MYSLVAHESHLHKPLIISRKNFAAKIMRYMCKSIKLEFFYKGARLYKVFQTYLAEEGQFYLTIPLLT